MLIMLNVLVLKNFLNKYCNFSLTRIRSKTLAHPTSMDACVNYRLYLRHSHLGSIRKILKIQ